MNGPETRLESLNRHLGNLEGKVAILERDVMTAQSNMAAIETRVTTRISELEEKVEKKIADVSKRVGDMDKRLSMFFAGLFILILASDGGKLFSVLKALM